MVLFTWVSEYATVTGLCIETLTFSSHVDSAANGSTATETPADPVVGRAETPSTLLLSTEEHTDTTSSMKPVVPGGGEPDVHETEEAGSANQLPSANQPPSANQLPSANQQPDALEPTEGDDEQMESPNAERDEQNWDPSSGITQVGH